jgi:hypothetical protein
MTLEQIRRSLPGLELRYFFATKTFLTPRIATLQLFQMVDYVKNWRKYI